MSLLSSRGGCHHVVAMVLLGLTWPINAQVANPPRWEEPILPPPGPAPRVDAVPVGPQFPIFGPGNDGPAGPPGHPPIETIPYMPLPEAGPWVPPVTDSVTVYDVTTGESRELPVIDPSGLPGGSGAGYIGADGWVTPAEWERNFGTMSVAGGLTSFPAAANCKLIMRFVDQNGNNQWFVCSGAMQDAGVVLTAAHCVYARNPNGINIFNWAAEIWVYPGWDGNGNQGNPGTTEVIQNWGWTRGTAYMAGTDYINNGNFDRDCGAIRVTRNAHRSIGMLTGWYGWAWGYSCSTIQGRTYYNFSYPAENCGGGLHTGTTMYFWSGTFDSCPGNQLQLDTTAGCLTAVWGGMSGSNAYYFDGPNRLAHAVCSNSNRSTVGRYCKMWEQWVIDMNAFRDATRGMTFDLEAFRFRLTGSTSVQATTTTSGCQFVASNTTNADPGNATYTVRVYLSTNNIISTGDTLVGTFAFNWDYVPMQNAVINLPGVTIPNVAPGTYWLGCILDPGTDAFAGNNATHTWDAQQITVTAAPPPPPPNNACGSGFTHAIGSTTYGNNGNATSDGSTTCGFNSNLDVWYSVTPPYTGTVQFDTCGSFFDTVISLHTSCPGTTGNQVACNDDAGSLGPCPFTLQSAMNVNVNGGQTYYMRVAGYNNTTGNFTLNSRYVPPANDNCSSAAAYTAGSTVGGTLAGAGNDGQASCGASGTAADVWYVMSPTTTGFLRIDTCGSTFDTVLSVHTACPGTTGNQIACNDDAGSVGSCPFTLQSVVDVGVVAGQTYYIRVSGFAGQIGSFTLRSAYIAPPNDACGNAIAYTPGTTTTGVTSGATNDGTASCGASASAPDVWYSMVATCTGTLRIETCGSNYDTVLSVHTICPGTTGNQLACNDDAGSLGSCPFTLQSRIDINVAAGTTYLLRIAGFAGASGAYVLSSKYLPISGADDCQNAPAVSDGSYVYSNCGATNDGPAENYCAFCCGDVQVNNDLWFVYTAPVTGTVTVDTCASTPPTYDTKIAVYAGSCPFGLPDSAIACNDDAGAGCGVSGLLSRTTFASVAGGQYLIRVGGFSASRGTGTLTISSTAAPTCDPDVNCDGSTDGFDVEVMEQAVGGNLSNYCQADTDWNGDGSTDGFDVEALEQVVGGAPCP